MKKFLLLIAAGLTLSAPLYSVKSTHPEHFTRSADIEVPSHFFEKPSHELPKSVALETLYGTLEITEPVIIELLHHPALLRLQEIDQHGPSTYFLNYPTFNRYTHSIGVFALLRKFGANLTVQIAGLLHDVSHTIFSHLADRFFNTGNYIAYQDHIHQWHLQKTGIADVLIKYGYAIEDMEPEHWPMLKNKLPALCADRIDYNIQAGVMFDQLSADDVTATLNDLRYENNTWFFATKESARKIGDASHYYTKEMLASAWNTAHHHWPVSALNVLVARNLVTFGDVHFGVDQKVLDLLEKSSDKHIKDMLKRCRTPDKYFKLVSAAEEHDLSDYPKNRALNPPVMVDGKIVPLTQIYDSFKKSFDDVKRHCQKGLKLKFL